MKKSKGTSRYSARQIETMRRKGRDRTDTKRINAMTDAEVEALAVEDDEGAFDWSKAKVGIPGPKQQLTMRLDKDVIDWFRAQGSGYQTRMNAVLRSFVEAQRERAR
jgi:uncharacterized protein (DUF4415 family)